MHIDSSYIAHQKINMHKYVTLLIVHTLGLM